MSRSRFHRQIGLVTLVLALLVSITGIGFGYSRPAKVQAAEEGTVGVFSYSVVLPAECYRKNMICETCVQNGSLLTFHGGDLKTKEHLPNECSKPGAPVGISKKMP